MGTNVSVRVVCVMFCNNRAARKRPHDAEDGKLLRRRYYLLFQIWLLALLEGVEHLSCATVDIKLCF